MSERKRAPSEVLRRGYSEDEVNNLYDLARMSLEAGALKRAEIIATGLTEVVPDFYPSWLILTYVGIWNRDHEIAAHAAQQAFRLAPRDPSVLLFFTAAKFLTADLQSAGTALGELGELVDSGIIQDNDLIRLYRLLLARFQTRTR